MWFDPQAAAVQSAAHAMFGGGKGYGKGMGMGYGGAAQPRSRGVCFAYRDTGQCKDGDNCRFEHIQGSAASNVNAGRRKLTGTGQNTDTSNGHNQVVDFADVENRGGCKLTVWETPPITKALTMTERTEDNGEQLVWQTSVSDGCNRDINVKIAERTHRKSKDRASGLMLGPKKARELAQKVLEDLDKITEPYEIPKGVDDTTTSEVGELKGMVSTLASGFQAQQQSLAAQTQSLSSLAASVQQSMQQPRVYAAAQMQAGLAGVRRAAVMPRGNGLPRKNHRSLGDEHVEMFGEDEEMPGEEEEVDTDEMELNNPNSDPVGFPNLMGDRAGGPPGGGNLPQLTPDQSEAVWKLLKSLSEKVTELLKKMKRVSPSQLLQYHDSDPLPTSFQWMLPTVPVDPIAGPIRSFLPNQMDLLASIFQESDYELVHNQLMQRIIDTCNPVACPVKRLTILALRYGVQLQGKVTLVRVLCTVALCVARNDRERIAATSPV